MAAALVALGLLAGCGGDGGGEDDEGGATASAACLERWNGESPTNLRQLMSFSNDPNEAVLVGTYSGEEFASEIYDTSTTGTGEDVTVARGDCVVKQSSGGMVIFVYVLSEDESGRQSWHRILESGDHPLATPGEQSLGDPMRTKISGFGSEVELKPAG